MTAFLHKRPPNRVKCPRSREPVLGLMVDFAEKSVGGVP
jgi:hypothetical protein